MIKRILNSLLIFSLLSLVASCGFRDASETGGSSTPKTDPILIKKNEALWDKTVAKEILTISELKKKKPSDTIYETEGYVVDSYKCDCPSILGAFVFCKCPPEHFVISEKTQLDEFDKVNNLEIRVITAPDGFERGQKYRFKVRIHESYDNEKVVEEVELVAFRQGADRRVEKSEASNTFSVKDIKDPNTQPGNYVIEGFVTKIFYCPPCPIFSGCEPCRRGNSIAVADKNGISDDTELNKNEILLATETPDSFEKGKRYTFTVKLSDEKLPNDPDLFVIKLLKFEKIDN